MIQIINNFLPLSIPMGGAAILLHFKLCLLVLAAKWLMPHMH
jgi:hypothetical protein